MPRPPAWRRYLRFWGPNVPADVDDELRFHFEMRTDELRTRGLSADAARLQAEREFGDVGWVRDRLESIDHRIAERRSRDERWSLLAQEARFALRRLVRQAGFTVPAVLTLALGLGAAAAVFTVLDRVVLRPLPYASAGRLVWLQSPVPGVGPDVQWWLGKGQYHYYLRESRSFDALGLYRMSAATVGSEAPGALQAERTGVAQVSASVARVLGVAPLLGRAMVPDDNLREEPQAAWLTHRLWASQFGADSSIVGRTILLSGRAVTVAGVLEPRAVLPGELAADNAPAGVWVPLHLDPAEPPRTSHTLMGIGRLRAGVTVEAAQAELSRLTARLPEALPEAYSTGFMERFGFSVAVTPLRDRVLGGVARTLWVVFGGVGLLLVIALANVTNLFLARIEARRRETAVRAALGAGRAQLARSFLAESLLLTAAAGALALLVAWGAVRLLVAAQPAGLPRLDEVRLGGTTALFVALVALAAGLLLGLLPVARRDGGTALLLEVGRGLTASRRQQAVRGTLVVAQIALSLVLLAGGALLWRSVRELQAVPSGLDPRGVLTAHVLLPQARYAEPAAVGATWSRIAERLAAIPGVAHVGATSSLPLAGDQGCSAIGLPHRPPDDEDRAPCVPVVLATPGYFATLGVPVRGREPDWADVRAGRPVAMVSAAFARRGWGDADPVGQRLVASNAEDVREVVAVVGDVRADGLDRPVIEAVYLPVLPVAVAVFGDTPRSLTFVLRAAAGDPARLAPAVRRAVAALDAQIAVTDVRPMSSVVARSMARVSFTALLLGLASAVALALSAIGIYGVIAYLVARRRAELGIRLALGARTAQVGGMVLLQSVRLAALGVALGLVGAWMATRALRALLYEVSPTDPVALGGTALVLLLVAALAGWVPARRAMRVDPAEALRAE